MRSFKDYEHLIRVAVVYAAAVLIFLGVRAALVPASFGQYGHYRADAIPMIAAQPMHYAGHQACEVCHDAEATLKHTGMHVTVNCEACHGPLAAHTQDPGGTVPAHLDTAVLCVRCHAANAARPKWFPQIIVSQHNAAGLPCETCHQPHSPLQGLTPAKGATP